VRLFLIVAGAMLAAFVLVAAALDPYDTGRFALVSKAGVPPQGPRTANASRGRDPAFDGAIIGNSHAQLLNPQNLTDRLGFPVVSLTVPATGPKEQLLILDWFLRNRERTPRLVVIGVDGYWCGGDPAMPNWQPFPFWLYAASPFEYLGGLVRFGVMEELGRRLRYVAGRIERARPDGWWDYEDNYIGLGYVPGPAHDARLAPRLPTMPDNATGRFPAAEALRERLKGIPAQTQVVLVRPPVYVTGLPEAGSVAAARDASCAAAYASVAAQRPRTHLLDRRIEDMQTRDRALFFDHTHYRKPIAAGIEAAIADLVR
jgi:hypothetical protein